MTYLSLTIILVAFAILTPYSSDLFAFLGQRTVSKHLRQVQDHGYQVQLFSTDPVIIYIKNFLSQDEIKHISHSVEGLYEPSRVYRDGSEGEVDERDRVSTSAIVPRDAAVRRIEQRAKVLMGWRNQNTTIQDLKTQRYTFNGFYTFHYDWIDYDARWPGNRMTTIMAYLEANCTGGGTNFPRLPHPVDSRWCEVIACEGDVEYEEYQGVTFKPIAGSAIFWDNFHPSGTPHEATRHAGLPVRSGQKTGLNIWSWDSSWTPPTM